MSGRWGLSARIVALSLLLLLLVQAAVFSVVRISIDQSARLQVAQELQVGERVWRRLLDQNAQQLRQGAAVLAADFGFRAAVSSGDLDTIRSALENNGARIGATITALIDTQLEMRALGEGANAAELAPVLTALTGTLSRDAQASQVALVQGVPHQFVMVPMKAPVLVAYLLMGFPINQRLVDDMRAISDMHLALLSDDGSERGRIVATTLSPEAEQALREQGGDVAELADHDDLLIARSVKLDTGSAGSVRALLLRSLNDVVAPFRQAQIALAWITAMGVCLFGIGSVFTARWVTTPLRSLVDAAQRMGLGQYDVPMEHQDRHDEIGGLARAFDHMRVDIGVQQDEIRKLAYWDRLTGLPNRARFREALQSEIDSQGAVAEMGHGTIAVVMLDIDRFKHVNDVLGYSFGDMLLVAVARRLTQQDLRAGDMVARLGGDEFAVLLSPSDAPTALAVAERIAKSFELPLTFDDQTVDLSAGIGVACWPTHADDADTLLSRAEVAMYAAKNRTTGIQLYDPALDSSSGLTLSLLTELRQAIDLEELRLFLQPKIRLSDDQVIAAEALVRWQHPSRGQVPPLEFIPFAEQTGFVRLLTLWMFERAALASRDLVAQGMELRLSVNLSTRDMLDIELPARLDEILQRTGAEASAFCLEITESAIMDDPQRALVTLEKLSQRGFQLSIDDFGTGYSSLAYLKRLPVDELKIDKSFVMNMQEDEDDAKIVRSTIDLAHNLGLSVVAEGVENAVILEHLRALACDEAQGYYVSKPMPAGELAPWCARWNAQARVMV
ncbi:EAL domain-containing protein [Comamonadaceae bacterium G21597-S1]|nr:EAL domain-containing protein [Comamonadaceae bacterium G21597-S1]